MDSGGFQELPLHGEWTVTVDRYIREYVHGIGKLQWAAIQDRIVEEHQRRTIRTYLESMDKAPEPVLQGRTCGDYWRHVDDYARADIELRKLPLVGLGSICRRQGTHRAAAIAHTLRRSDGVRIHAFGVKTARLELMRDDIASADSLARSFTARRGPPLPGCKHEHCNNCLKFALKWRAKILGIPGVHEAPPAEEPSLFG